MFRNSDSFGGFGGGLGYAKKGVCWGSLRINPLRKMFRHVTFKANTWYSKHPRNKTVGYQLNDAFQILAKWEMVEKHHFEAQ